MNIKIPLLQYYSPETQISEKKLSPFSSDQCHNSCANSLAIIEYIKDEKPEMLARLFDDLGDEMAGVSDVERFLTDPNNWVSSSLMIRLFANARDIMEDDDVAFHIGFNSILKKRFGYVQKILIYTFGNPSSALKKIQKVNDYFNKTKVVKLDKCTKTGAQIRLLWDDTIPLSRDFCSYNKGIYQAIPTIWGRPPAELIETKSFFDGDAYCEYYIKWQPDSRLRSFFFRLLTPGQVVRDTIVELERDKELLKEKYNHINVLNRTLERKVAELTTLQESSTAILSTLQLEELLDVIVAKLMDVADLDRAGIFLANKKKASLVLIHAIGIEKPLVSRFKGYEIPLDKVDNIIARSAHSKEPVYVEDVASLSLNPDNLLLKRLCPKAFILVPLNVRGEIIGIMVGDNNDNQDFIHKTDRNFLKGFANHIAMALDNARIYKKLKESEQRYREIIENVDEGIWVLDEHGTIKFANTRLVAMLGYGDLAGMRIYDLVDQESRQQLMQIMLDNVKGMTSKHEVELQTKDGDSKTVLLSSVPIKAEKRFAGFLAIVTDLTEKKNLEKKLLQSQKLESVGTMAGGIAHDFNNILTGILGYTTLLQAELSGNPELKKYTDVIEKSSIRAADLVSKMLTFSRHSPPTEGASVSLDETIQDSIVLLQSSLSRGTQVEYTGGRDVPLVACDATQAQQIVLNLCINACDAMPDGGRIMLSLDTVTQDVVKHTCPEVDLAEDEYVQLQVRDTGEGIPGDVLERIFDPFFTTKEVGKGSGLGLAMVYGILQSIGGSIHVADNVPVGTVFTLFFPVFSPGDTQDVPSLQHGTTGTETILIVDDEDVVRTLSREVLEPLGYQVVCAEDGVQAVDIYKAMGHAIDLVVLDMVMPHMGGKATYLQLKAINKDVRVLFCSAQGTRPQVLDIDPALAGMPFTEKPFSAFELPAAIRRVLQDQQ